MHNDQNKQTKIIVIKYYKLNYRLHPDFPVFFSNAFISSRILHCTWSSCLLSFFQSVTATQSFLVFPCLFWPYFKEYWSVVLKRIIQYGLMWCSSMIRLRLWIWDKTVKLMCPSLFIISEIRDTWYWYVLLLMIFTLIT